MVALLKKKGVDPATVTFRNVGSNADIFRAVVAGTVDAGPSGIDVYDQQAKYHTHSLSDGDLWTELPEYTYQGTFTSDRAIADKREALVRTLAAFARLYRFVQSPDSQDLFIQSYAKAVGNPDPAEAESTWTFIQKIRSYAVDIVLSEERIRYMQDLNVELGVQKSVLPTNEVADSSLAREALKLLA